jgi:hypothetical protein
MRSHVAGESIGEVRSKGFSPVDAIGGQAKGSGLEACSRRGHEN